MGRVWNQELDEEQKAPFQAQHQQLLVEWKKAMDAYKLGDVKKGPKEKGEGAEVVEGHVLEGDMRSKEEPHVEKNEQGREFKEEGGKRDEDMEIDEREEGAVEVGDVKGEVGDMGSEKRH